MKLAKHERLEMLREAISLVEEAMTLVDDVVGDTHHDPHYRAYGKYGFDDLLGNSGGRGTSLPELLDEMTDEEF